MKKYFVYNEVSCISSHGFNTRVEAEQEYAKHQDKYKSAAKIVEVDMKDEEEQTNDEDGRY